MLSQSSVDETTSFNLSSAIAIFSLCSSIMNQCNCWNWNPLVTIVDNGTKLCDLKQLSPSNLPRTINVCGAEVNIENVIEIE